ncbi:MAG TPA: dephospho-CoA kinase, partial [Bacteroidales bacterium]|nr:dephospho-CoA kinase [Bacteroidales bacterium]
MIEVGLSGGIGSGKTYASRIFQNLGIAVYEADSRAKILMNTNQQLIDEITQLMGKQAYADGVLQTKYIAQQIFSTPQL